MYELKIEGTIYEIKAGVLTKIKIGDVVYELRQGSIQTTMDDFKSPTPPPQQQSAIEFPSGYNGYKYSGKDRGNIIGKTSLLHIYENVCKDVKEALTNGAPTEKLVSIMKEYYPEPKRKSLISYIYAYRRWIMGSKKRSTKTDDIKGEKIGRFAHCSIFKNIYDQIKIEMDKGKTVKEMMPTMKPFYPEAKEDTIENYTGCYRSFIKQKMGTYHTPISSKRRRSKPKDAIGFDEVYQVWIKPPLYDQIKACVAKLDFVATSKSIADELKTPIDKVRAYLHYLTEKKVVYWKKDKSKVVVYHLLP